MSDDSLPEPLKRHEIPGRVRLVRGYGGLLKIDVESVGGSAEVFLHGAHVTRFQKHGEPPLLFLSQASQFAAGKPIRGGVPIVYPWFGPRDGSAMHGFARVTVWDWIGSSAAPDGSVTLRFRLPESVAVSANAGHAEVRFIVTVSERLTMELQVSNPSTAEPFAFENCLHTYFTVGGIEGVSVTGLEGATFLDKMDQFARKTQSGEPIRISSETDRVYLHTTSAVDIHDALLHRTIRVEKSGSASTVLWNPWVAKAKAMPDFGDEEFRGMICVESGNVAENRLTLAPGATAGLKVTLSSRSL